MFHFLSKIQDCDEGSSEFREKHKYHKHVEHKSQNYKGFKVLLAKTVFEPKNESFFFIESNIREFINE